MHRSSTRFRVALAFVLAIAALHLVNLRSWLPPAWRPPYASYFSDLTIPFAFYFLLCLIDDRIPWLRSAMAKALAVSAAATSAELLQGVGIPVLGRTFDPWDIVMYVVGAGAGALLDRVILARVLPAWPLAKGSGNRDPHPPVS